ncbi:MAG: bifunctional nuclease family protein [Candidatus Neomarinimicrobiota bacterium]
MIPVEVTKISFYPPSKGYAVVLQEIGGQGRKLPVIVGSFEAQAIALALENVETPRPMTHDLISTILEEVEVNIKQVVITHLSDGTFFAEIRVESDHSGRCDIDTRPSDAIAIALRLDSPIFVSEMVMGEAGVEEGAETGLSFEELRHGSENSRHYLEEQLQKAIEEEEYEAAAELRDKILRLAKKE